MIRNILLSCLSVAALAPTALASSEPSAGLLAIRVGKAETISQGTIEHAVILVDNGRITAVGEDLPVERGIPILDRPDWVVMPGLVNCYSRAGMDSQAGSGFEPTAMASGELYARQDIYRDLLEQGVTTLGLYPPGTGVSGQAVAVKPMGTSEESMILSDGVYLKAYLQSDPASKKRIRKGFEEVDKYDEKVDKAREKWEKAQEKKKKKKKSKKDDDKKADDKDDEKSKGKDDGEKFAPPAPDDSVRPFVNVRKGKLPVLFRIQKAADYLHLIDVIEDEEDVRWHLRVPLRNDIDLFHVADRIGELELNVVLDPRLTYQPNSRRERNIPAEIDAAGGHVALIPRSDGVNGHKAWRVDVGLLVSHSLDRDAALAAMTLVPATVLGLEERLGSLEPGKDANLVFYNGDPFEPSSSVQAVMLEGEFVFEKADR